MTLINLGIITNRITIETRTEALQINFSKVSSMIIRLTTAMITIETRGVTKNEMTENAVVIKVGNSHHANLGESRNPTVGIVGMSPLYPKNLIVLHPIVTEKIMTTD